VGVVSDPLNFGADPPGRNGSADHVQLSSTGIELRLIRPVQLARSGPAGSLWMGDPLILNQILGSPVEAYLKCTSGMAQKGKPY
jgi:hypothetical protein